MTQRLGAFSLLVQDYDEAIAFFTHALRFELLEDTPLGAGKRWVRVAPAGAGEGGGTLLLARAANDAQRAMVGRQGAGRVLLFLHTSDFGASHSHMLRYGVRFLEAPRQEAYGRVAVFQDLYGNKWDLLEAAKAGAASGRNDHNQL